MNFYYDAIIGLVYSFEPNIVILEVNKLPEITPKEIIDLYFAKSILWENASEADKAEVSFNVYITCNLFDCEFDVMDWEPIKNSSYDGMKCDPHFLMDEIGHYDFGHHSWLLDKRTEKEKPNFAGTKGWIQQIEEAPIPELLTREEAKRKMDAMGKEVSNRVKENMLNYMFPENKNKN